VRAIAQHNLWFMGPPKNRNYRLQGKSMISLIPRLGRTSSSDAGVLRQEMQWLHRYTGRDGRNFVYSLEWISPDHLIDENLNAVFLPEIEKTKATWNIFYDPVLAANNRELGGSGPLDFSKPKLAEMLRSDLAYMWANYFGHSQYWRLRGKPVFYIWAVANGTRNIEPLIAEAQSQGVYVLGDVFGSSEFPPDMDGFTGFVAATPQLQGLATEIPSVLSVFEKYFLQYGAPDSARPGDVIPAISCQYDDTRFRNIIDRPATRILARNRKDVERFLRLVKSNSQRIDGEKYAWIGTTNNWAEATTLLPTVDKGPQFLNRGEGFAKAGNYGYQHLEAVHNVLFPSEPAYIGPRILQREDGSIRFVDCDLLGELQVKNANKVDNPPDWATGMELRDLKNFGRQWRPQNPRGVVLRFRNLDGRSNRMVVRE